MMAVQAIKQMEKSMHNGIGKSLVRVRLGKPVVKDVPLLIRALEIDDDFTRENARMWLAKLSGQDYGDDVARWEAWWQAERPRLKREEADEHAAEFLFASLRQDVMTGRWSDVRLTMARELRKGMSAADLAAELKAHKRDLRAVFRDAKITSLDLGATEGIITVDWGEVGFESKELPIVREGPEWRFAERPWTGSLVRRRETEEKELHYHRPGRRPKHERASSLTPLMFLFTVLGILIVFPAAFFMTGGSVPAAALAAFLTGPAVASLIWVMDRASGRGRLPASR